MVWENQYGKNYFYQIEMDNGDKGQYMSRSDSQSYFEVGKEVDYEYQEINENDPQGNPKPNRIKPVNVQRKGFQRGYKKQPQNNKSFALSYAKDIAVAHIGQGKDFKAQQIIQVADEFYKWLES